jgi:chaperonin GroES
MKFRPLHDRVVIRRVNAEEKTTGGIIIPDTAQEKPTEGKVLAAGPGTRNEQGQLVPLDVKEGDRILFGRWSGTEVKLDAEELLIMKESDIMGIIEGAPAVKKKAACCGLAAAVLPAAPAADRDSGRSSLCAQQAGFAERTG